MNQLPICRPFPGALHRLLLLVAFWLTGMSTAAAQNIDMANWMRDLDATIGNRPLKTVVIPGAHDAAMFKGMVDGDLAKNHDLDLAGLLDHGVRYFDFRLGYYLKPKGSIFWQNQSGQHISIAMGNKLSRDDYYLYGHGGQFIVVVDVTLRDALASVRNWLARHPKEVVIFDARIDASDASGVFGIFRSYFPNLICGSSNLPDLPDRTLNEIRRVSQVVLLGDAKGLRCKTEAARVGYKDGGGIQAPNLQAIYLNDMLRKERPKGMRPDAIRKMLVLITPLTALGRQCGTPLQTPECLGSGFNPTLSPFGLANEWNPRLEYLIKNDWRDHLLNVVTMDYVRIGTVPKTLVQRNLEQR